MKSILSASVCVAALAFAVPAMAATTDTPPKHMHHHHMSKMGPKTHMKPAGDPTTAQLNERSLNAARGGSSGSAAPATGDATTTPMTPPAASTSTPMTQPSSGSTGTTAPNNAPSGG